jgi:hypothetical protein
MLPLTSITPVMLIVQSARRRLLDHLIALMSVLSYRLEPMVIVTLSVLVVSWMATMALSTPVIHIAGSTGLSVRLFISESRGLPRSSFGSLLHFAAGLLSLLWTFRRSRLYLLR